MGQPLRSRHRPARRSGLTRPDPVTAPQRPRRPPGTPPAKIPGKDLWTSRRHVSGNKTLPVAVFKIVPSRVIPESGHPNSRGGSRLSPFRILVVVHFADVLDVWGVGVVEPEQLFARELGRRDELDGQAHGTIAGPCGRSQAETPEHPWPEGPGCDHAVCHLAGTQTPGTGSAPPGRSRAVQLCNRVVRPCPSSPLLAGWQWNQSLAP